MIRLLRRAAMFVIRFMALMMIPPALASLLAGAYWLLMLPFGAEFTIEPNDVHGAAVVCLALGAAIVVPALGDGWLTRD